MSKTSAEVKQRWIAKAYQRYTINLRRDRDQAIIDYIDNADAAPTDVIRAALLEKIEREH